MKKIYIAICFILLGVVLSTVFERPIKAIAAAFQWDSKAIIGGVYNGTTEVPIKVTADGYIVLH